MSNLFVGVDIGTSHLKVGVFSLDEGLKALSQRDCAPEYGEGGRVEIEAETWWGAFESAFTECLDRVERSAIRAIGVSSQAQTYVFLDGRDRFVGPAVSWLDTRGDAEGTAAHLAREDFYGHVGWGAPMSMLASCKLRSLADFAGKHAAAVRLLFPDGVLIRRLTGEHVVSRNLAAMSGLYSLIRDDWWPEAVAAAKVPPAILPEVRSVGEQTGRLDESLAQAWQISRVPIVVGANDQTAAAIGAGLAEPGDTSLNLGTALVTFQVIDPDAPVLLSKPLRGPYLGGLQYQLGLCNTGCAVLDWACRSFGGADVPAMIQEAASTPPGAAGLRFNPNLTDEHSRGGALVGLRLEHRRPHLFRAVLEALASVAREQLDKLGAPRDIYLTGGGSAGDGWMQMIADLSRRNLLRLDHPHATLWGTAALAAGGAGAVNDVSAVTRNSRRLSRTFEPFQDDAEVYEKVYRDYQRISKTSQIRAR